MYRLEFVPEDVSLYERCPHFRGCYVQASMELGPEDVSLLERCPHFRGCYKNVMCWLQWSWDLKIYNYYVPIRGVLISECYVYTGFNGVETACRCREVPEGITLYV